MSKLIFHSVKFKNFLSFGSHWQEIEFQNGINIITGRNGSGKSSCMDTIPFALFGKTHKDIKKADLINWKNRKGLEVQIELSKGSDRYRIVRAIKPDNFEIYKNDVLIDKESHVRDYQTVLEDIIGTNLQTFTSLIHSNINSSQPIFGMSKPDKRKFIEKVFGLSVYSDITEKCNGKLSSINTKVRELGINISNNKSNINEAEKTIEGINTKIRSLSSSSNSTILLNEAKEELNSICFMKEDEYKLLKDNMVNTLKEQEHCNSLISKVNSRVGILESKIRTLNRNLPEKTEPCSGNIDEMRKLYESNEKKVSELQQSVRSTQDDIKKCKYDLDSILKKEKLLNSGVCPTCGQDIHYIMLEGMKSEIDSLELSKSNLEALYKEEYEKLSKLVSDDVELVSNIDQLESYIRSEKERQEILSKLKRYTDAHRKLESTKETLSTESVNLSNSLSLMKESYESEKRLIQRAEKLQNTCKLLETKLASEESVRKELEDIIDNNNNNIEKWNKNISEHNNELKKLNDIKDYIEYIKTICSDSNIRAYAISSIIPVLTKNVNKYLSDIGRPFYLNIDNWLEPTIKGPGITSGSYYSLSSGESKSVDLSLQSAFLDIARIQSGVFPDLLIFDELLDSSLDDDSLNTLLSIIYNKQKEDNNKVYIISHREEINEIGDIANMIRISKEGGFSKIQYV